MKELKVIKKDGRLEEYNREKILNAVEKSAKRVLVELTPEQQEKLLGIVEKQFVYPDYYPMVRVDHLHHIVEKSLMKVDKEVAESYKSYRNYKQTLKDMSDNTWVKAQSILYRGDKENSNADSTLVSTKQSLIRGEISRQFYRNFFLTAEEREATEIGFIYNHDERDRMYTMNCCLADVGNIMQGGFESGNIWINEPKSVDIACDVLGDIIMSMSAQQYGGFTVPHIDRILVPYCLKSYDTYVKELKNVVNESLLVVRGECSIDMKKIEELAMKKVRRDLEQGIQGYEIKLNTVASSRGDYPFVTFTFGAYENFPKGSLEREFAKMICEVILEVRKNGQGAEGHKKPVLFPKLNFLYIEHLHGEDKEDEYLFDLAIQCSAKAMYPDYLSLTGEGYIPSIYKKYGEVISLMGCRASLSPYYRNGGIKPHDEYDTPVFVGRFNIGAISLNLPLIYQEAKVTGRDFFEFLDYFLEMIRQLHLRTYDYLGNMKASMNPLGFTQGGFLGGNLQPNDRIAPVLDSATASFGITALNELCQLHYGKSIREDNSFAKEVMEHINKRVQEFKEADHRLYAVYGTPAESLVGLQVKQFRERFGIIKNVSDKDYVSNSFHCHVAEDITPFEKQDKEYEMWDYFNGGKIAYNRYPIAYNHEAMKSIVRRGMHKGFYLGVNLALSYCDDCGHQELDMDVCPKCGSTNLTKIDRMNGYLSYSRVKGESRLNDAKMEEIKERKSM